MSIKLLVFWALINMFSARQINEAGLKLIQKWEGFEPNFYNDSVGIKTIGYGHACHVNDCDKIIAPLTIQQGVALLMDDLQAYESCVDKSITDLDIDKFSSLVSFAYNLGCTSLNGSTLAKYTRAKNYTAAAGEFGKWVYAGGVKLNGLVNRRADEKALFCSSGC